MRVSVRHTEPPVARATPHWQWFPGSTAWIAQPPAAIGASGTVPRTEQLAVHRRWAVGCADVCGDIPDQAPVGGRALGASIVAPTNAVLRLNKKPNPHSRGEPSRAVVFTARVIFRRVVRTRRSSWQSQASDRAVRGHAVDECVLRPVSFPHWCHTGRTWLGFRLSF